MQFRKIKYLNLLIRLALGIYKKGRKKPHKANNHKTHKFFYEKLKFHICL